MSMSSDDAIRQAATAACRIFRQIAAPGLLCGSRIGPEGSRLLGEIRCDNTSVDHRGHPIENAAVQGGPCPPKATKGRQTTMVLKEGDRAPDFRLPRDGGEEVSLESFRGRKLVLYAYPKDDTTGCTREAIDFNRLRPEFAACATEIVGVSPDSAQRHDRFKLKHQLDLTLLADESQTLAQAYGIWTEKSMYGRKFMGIERSTFLIDAEGRIARIWRKVKVAGHAEEVLAAARAL
ncbi:peroxiredoxin [Bosea sp. 67-29]|uniref:peroxiredoxin n=1 Tax=unclassified Bosea (in: a-proteobacteria) TaxID=2653178 RepID=UPI0034325C54